MELQLSNGRNTDLNGIEAHCSPDDIQRRLAKVQLLAMDVDGVLTDGTIAYDDAGHEQKRFHVSDGLGLVVLRQCDIGTAWISGRHHAGVDRRARELGITVNRQMVRDKQLAMNEICEHLNVPLNEVVYIGDDWNDLPVMASVGCPVAVANAVAEVRSAALFITNRRGGDGAVREVCEAILEARGIKSDAIKRYLSSLSAESDLVDCSVM